MTTRAPVIEFIEDELAATLRAKTPAQRLAGAHAMWRYARDRLLATLRRRHPDWDDETIKAELRRRMLGPS